MLLSGKLKPATVSVPLEAGLGFPPPPVLPHAAATKTSVATAARNLPEPRFEFIEPFSLPPVCLPIHPGVPANSRRQPLRSWWLNRGLVLILRFMRFL